MLLISILEAVCKHQARHYGWTHYYWHVGGYNMAGHTQTLFTSMCDCATYLTEQEIALNVQYTETLYKVQCTCIVNIRRL